MKARNHRGREENMTDVKPFAELMDLVNPLNGTIDPADEKLAREVLQALEKHPASREAVDNWAKAGYEVVFANMSTKVFHGSKRFILSKRDTPDKLADSIVASSEGLTLNQLKFVFPKRKEEADSFKDSLSRILGNDAQRERYGKMLDELYSRPEGKKLLERLAFHNTRVAFNTDVVGDERGTFDKRYDCILLNENLSGKELSETFETLAKEAVAYAERPNRQVLKEAFETKTPEEEGLAERLIETAYKTPVGAEIMDQMAKAGYSIHFENIPPRKDGTITFGFCSFSSRRIVLDPKHPFESMISTFVHESEHALQNERYAKSGLDRRKLDVASMFKKSRAMEADACAHEALFAWQIKDVHPEIYQYNQSDDINRAFIREMENSGDPSKSMSAAFMQWYDSEGRQGSYEKDHFEYAEHTARCGIARQVYGYFSDEASSKEVLDGCLVGGKPYVEPSFLDSPIATAIKDETKQKLDALMLNYSRAVETKMDTSLFNMASREKLAAERRKQAELESMYRDTFRNEGFNSEEQKALVQGILDCPEGEKAAERLKGVNLWFEKSDKPMEYMPQANALIVDPDRIPEAAREAVRHSRLIEGGKLAHKCGNAGLLAFKPSLLVSPKEEARRLQSVMDVMCVREKNTPMMVREMKALNYEIAFSDDICGDSIASVPRRRRMIVLHTDASNTPEMLADAMLKEMKKLPERHAAEMPVARLAAVEKMRQEMFEKGKIEQISSVHPTAETHGKQQSAEEPAKLSQAVEKTAGQRQSGAPSKSSLHGVLTEIDQKQRIGQLRQKIASVKSAGR